MRHHPIRVLVSWTLDAAHPWLTLRAEDKVLILADFQDSAHNYPAILSRKLHWPIVTHCYEELAGHR